jgi:hypothetical protein
MAVAQRSWMSWIGLAAGPTMWAAGTQLKYALVGSACERQAWQLTLGISLATASIAAVATFLSWRVWRARPAEHSPTPEVQVTQFLAALSVLVGLVFVLAILLQGAAGFVFSGCEP